MLQIRSYLEYLERVDSLLDIHGLRCTRVRDPGYFETIKELSSAWKIMHDEIISIQDVSNSGFYC
jgi:hypothetical protein